MAEKIGEGGENEELTEFEIRKNEKEKEVLKLREDHKVIHLLTNYDELITIIDQ